MVVIVFTETNGVESESASHYQMAVRVNQYYQEKTNPIRERGREKDREVLYE